MIGRTVFLLVLIGAAPAAAADLDPGAPAITASNAQPNGNRHALPNEPTGNLRYSVRQIDALDAPSGSTALLGSLNVVGVDLGVGLFSVLGASEKEIVRRRTQPMLEIRDRDRRVPGVGMSLRF